MTDKEIKSEEKIIEPTKNIKINRCKYCMDEIPEGYYCCKSCYDDFED